MDYLINVKNNNILPKYQQSYLKKNFLLIVIVTGGWP